MLKRGIFFPLQITPLELALVHLSVYDKDDLSVDDFIGQCVVPLTSLMPGAKFAFNSLVII